MNNYYINMTINDLQTVRSNIISLLNDINVLNKKLSNNFLINDKIFQKEILDSLISDLNYINNNISTNIIPRLKNKLSN